jgi:hypothetical protein
MVERPPDAVCRGSGCHGPSGSARDGPRLPTARSSRSSRRARRRPGRSGSCTPVFTREYPTVAASACSGSAASGITRPTLESTRPQPRCGRTGTSANTTFARASPEVLRRLRVRAPPSCGQLTIAFATRGSRRGTRARRPPPAVALVACDGEDPRGEGQPRIIGCGRESPHRTVQARRHDRLVPGTGGALLLVKHLTSRGGDGRAADDHGRSLSQGLGHHLIGMSPSAAICRRVPRAPR